MFGVCPLASAATKKPVKKAAVAKPATPKIAVPKASPEPLVPGELPLVAQAAALVDAKTGNLIYQKRADQLQYPASTTKILTALLVIEAGDLDKLPD